MHSTQTPNTENVYALNSLNIEQFAVFVEDITVLLNDHRECCDLCFMHMLTHLVSGRLLWIATLHVRWDFSGGRPLCTACVCH